MHHMKKKTVSLYIMYNITHILHISKLTVHGTIQHETALL